MICFDTIFYIRVRYDSSRNYFAQVNKAVYNYIFIFTVLSRRIWNFEHTYTYKRARARARMQTSMRAHMRTRAHLQIIWSLGKVFFLSLAILSALVVIILNWASSKYMYKRKCSLDTTMKHRQICLHSLLYLLQCLQLHKTVYCDVVFLSMLWLFHGLSMIHGTSTVSLKY